MLSNTHLAGIPVALSPSGTSELWQLSCFWSWTLAQIPLHHVKIYHVSMS